MHLKNGLVLKHLQIQPLRPLAQKMISFHLIEMNCVISDASNNLEVGFIDYPVALCSSSCTSTVPQFFEIFCKNNASNDSSLLLIPYTAMVQFLQEVPMHRVFSFLLSLILTWRKNFRNPTRTLWLSFAQKLPKQHWLSWGEKLCINHVIEHFNSYCPPDLTLYCAWEKICLNDIMEHFDLNFTTYSISSSIEDWHWLCKKTPSPLPEHILVSFWIFCFLGLFPLALW